MRHAWGLVLIMSLKFEILSNWQRLLFATALLQRMLPNYRVFSDATSFGDYHLIQNLLDLVWQKLHKLPMKINVDVQLEKLESHIPEAEKFEVFAVFPAIDVCTGLIATLQSLAEPSTHIAKELSLLSKSSVAAYLELLMGESGEHTMAIGDDPLMQWEEEMQSAIFELIFQSSENKQTCIEVKKLVTSQRLTNLGIEY